MSTHYDEDYDQRSVQRAKMSYGSSSLLIGVISLANLLILILAIVIMLLSLGNWNDYVTCTFTIIIALSWTCCVCVQNNLAISFYGILMIIDMIILFANAIYYLVVLTGYGNYCFDLREDSMAPPYGCYEWKNNGKSRTIAMVACFFVAIFFRMVNILGSCLLARNLYNS